MHSKQTHSNLIQISPDEIEIDDWQLLETVRVDLSECGQHRARDVTVKRLVGSRYERWVEVDDNIEVAKRGPKRLLRGQSVIFNIIFCRDNNTVIQTLMSLVAGLLSSGMSVFSRTVKAPRASTAMRVSVCAVGTFRVNGDVILLLGVAMNMSGSEVRCSLKCW